MLDLNKPVQTKTGETVKILSTEGRWDGFPIIGYVENSRYIDYWSLNGINLSSRDSDLINVPEEHTLWFNMYKSPVHGNMGIVHPTRESADRDAGDDRIACLEIKYKDGDGI